MCCIECHMLLFKTKKNEKCFFTEDSACFPADGWSHLLPQSDLYPLSLKATQNKSSLACTEIKYLKVGIMVLCPYVYNNRSKALIKKKRLFWGETLFEDKL